MRLLELSPSVTAVRDGVRTRIDRKTIRERHLARTVRRSAGAQ